MPILPRSEDGSVNYSELVNSLGKTWPARMAKSAYEGITLPGDVYQGNVSMWGEDGRTNTEAIDRAADLAGIVMSGSLAAPKGAIGVGPVRGRASKDIPLPRDTNSRFSRADDMGFYRNIDLYHGSARDFNAFKSVPTSADGMVTPGISLALNPKIADEFSTLGGKANPQVYKVWHRAKSPAVLNLEGSESHGQVVATLRDAFDGGHDAVMLKNYISPGGTKGDIIIVRDANQLRSPSAMFDPSNINSSNLLASLAGAAAVPVAFDYFHQLHQGRSDQ